MTYGAALPGLTYSYSGFVNGDGSSTVQGAPSLTVLATSKSPVGSYVIGCGPGTLTSLEYTFQLGNGTLTVNKAGIAVKGASLAMTYGGPLPDLAYQSSGFVNGDTAAAVSGAPLLTSSVTGATAVGTYPMSVAAGSLSAQNYSFSFANGTITVNKAMLTVSANNLSMLAGGTMPALTYSTSGWVNGETQTTLAGVPALTTGVTAASKPGSYTIAAGQGSLKAVNYQFNLIQGTFTVIQSTLNRGGPILRRSPPPILRRVPLLPATPSMGHAGSRAR
jgi:hypothetical protein